MALHLLLTASHKRCRRKIILILDNLRVYHARLVKEWVEKRDDQIEFHYLPSYRSRSQPSCSRLSL
ncbi:MAG: transposase [Verrucomicrobiales bacterium]